MSAAPPQLDPATVQSFVANAHGDFEAVRALLADEPRLVNAAWDWGGGDWETALGAAAHMGRRQIALFLLEHGVRLDLFAAAMLGYFDIVSAVLSDFPEMHHAILLRGCVITTLPRDGLFERLQTSAPRAERSEQPLPESCGFQRLRDRDDRDFRSDLVAQRRGLLVLPLALHYRCNRPAITTRASVRTRTCASHDSAGTAGD